MNDKKFWLIWGIVTLLANLTAFYILTYHWKNDYHILQIQGKYEPFMRLMDKFSPFSPISYLSGFFQGMILILVVIWVLDK